MADTTQETKNAEVKTQDQPEKALSLKDSFKKDFEQVQEQLMQAMPAMIDKSQLVRVYMTAITSNSELLKCTKVSLFSCLLTAAYTGLEVNTPNQEAYLIPYSKKQKDGSYALVAQFQPGYRGLIKVARRSQQIASIDSDAVREKDHFVYKKTWDGTVFEHEFPLNEDRGQVIGAYAMAKLTTGEKTIIVLTKSDIERLKNANQAVKAGKFSPWSDWYDEMSKGKALKRLSKLLPTTNEMALLNHLDNLAETGKNLEFDIKKIAGKKDLNLLTEGTEVELVDEVEEKATASENGKKALENAKNRAKTHGKSKKTESDVPETTNEEAPAGPVEVTDEEIPAEGGLL